MRLRFWTQTGQVFRAPWARVVLVTAFLEGMVLFGALSFIPVYLYTRYGVTLLAAGVIAAVFGVGGLAYVTLAPMLLRRLGEVGLAIGGGVLLGASFLSLRLAPNILLTLPAIFAIGLGFFMLHNTLQTNATQMLPAARGTAVATFASALFIGQSVGVALASVVVDEVGVSWLLVAAGAMLPLIAFDFVRKLRRRDPTAQARDVAP